MIQIENCFSLKDFNTFGIPVTTRYFASFSTREELLEILDFAGERSLDFFVLGGGANLLFTHNFEGLIIHPIGDNIVLDGNVVIADAGVVWDNLVEKTVNSGLGGLENLSLIPGSVGAAPVQNIGAYGVEAKDTILWVEYMDVIDRQIYQIGGEKCKFGYRDSIFKHDLAGRAVILRVAFKLTEETSSYHYMLDYGALKSSVTKASLLNVRNAVIDIRRSKLPDPAVIGSAGSFFRNPEIGVDRFDVIKENYPDVVAFELPSGNIKLSAGWLIEKAGWKGRSLGSAAVHDKQALVLVNKGGATGADVLALCDKVRSDVVKMFGVELQPEVIIL